jgi:hypothetical protein
MKRDAKQIGVHGWLDVGVRGRIWSGRDVGVFHDLDAGNLGPFRRLVNGCRMKLRQGLARRDRNRGRLSGRIIARRRRELLALDEALEALAEVDPRKARIVELGFFGGLSVKETAEVVKVSSDTVMRDWKLARAWLLTELSSGS